MLLFFWIFLAACLVSVLATVLVKKAAQRYGIQDLPEIEPERRAHKTAIPKLGGLSIIFAFDLITLVLYSTLPLVRDNLPLASMLAIWLGSLALGFGGALDDLKNLPPGKQFGFTVLAALLVVASGMGIPHITNPFGGKIALAGPAVGGIGLVSAIFVFCWIMGMMYTTKFLDGLDGLASSIALVATAVIFALSFTPVVQQPYTAALAAALAGAILGFLFFNWHPAKIFLGEAGSVFLGFILGILAIIAGGKVATAFLVMGIPILDVAWVILRRIIRGRSPFKADRLHLHFRLLDLGLSQRQTVLVFSVFALAFGGAAVVLQSFGKFVSVLALFAIMIIFGLWVVHLSRRGALTKNQK